MKLNAIKSVCTKAKQFTLYTDQEGTAEYIGTEEAMYPIDIDGLAIEESSIESLFDLSGKQMEKIKINSMLTTTSGLNVAVGGYGSDSVMIEEGMIPLWWGGSIHRTLEYGRKLYMVNTELTKPAEGSGDYVQFHFARNDAGEVLIVVFDGMTVSGIVKPDNATTVETIQRYLKYMSLLGNEDTKSMQQQINDALNESQIGFADEPHTDQEDQEENEEDESDE